MHTPKLLKISQKLDDTVIEDIASEIESELMLKWSRRPAAGDKVAITVGSRGISNIADITAAVIKEVKKTGAEPFIIPTMGSHGGATADGQQAVLKEYGITEDTMGVPIRSSMEVVHIGDTKSGIPVFIDKIAYSADHIVVVNRIKPHTEFQGSIESGLIKMMVIGLGKHKGASIAHQFAVKLGYEQTLTEAGRLIIQNAPISVGLGIIENGYNKVASLVAVPASEIYETEKTLLEIARKKSPKLPFNEIDILIVDECGKEISGTGMDTKVVGRIMNIYELELTQPHITRIILRDLTEKTHGNGVGIGLADFVTKRVVDKLDHHTTCVNCVTAVTPEKARIPIICENDKKAIAFALDSVGPVDAENVRIVWIKNTSKLDEMFISDSLLPETEMNDRLQVIDSSVSINFDAADNLISP